MTIALLLAGLTASHASTTLTVDVGRGPVQVAVPNNLGPGPLPLIVNMHGYSGDSATHEAYTGFLPLVDPEGFVYVVPDGETDLFGLQYWNATDYCCDFFGNTDDVGYLADLLDAVEATVSVDPQRVYFAGHSNGGFMSHRMACEHVDRVAGIASFAGSAFDDPADCAATEPVNVLQIHGTTDTVIQFGGDCVGASCYPSAQDTVRQWYDRNNCTGAPARGPALDLDVFNAGDETRTFFAEACDPGGAVALWIMDGSGHSPLLTSDFATSIVRYLLDHPKP